MRTVLITGATSGIGMEFARNFEKRGYRLILTGRRGERLRELQKECSTDVRTIVADLSYEDECFRLLEELKDEKIDIFINNAGFGACGEFAEIETRRELSMIKVNISAMHILFKGILKNMKKRDKGIIMNVASSAGLMPGGPYMATYYATKAYVVSLTRGVAAELREANSKVYVCALCPGPVDTEFNDNAGVSFAIRGISAKRCVKEAIRGMGKQKTIIIPSAIMRMAMAVQRLLPAEVSVNMAGRQQKKKLEEKQRI